MSESGYTEIDLDALPKPEPDTRVEIVEEPVEESVFITEEEESKAQPAASETDDDDDDDEEGGSGGKKKRTTRTQRLKAQRDAYAQKLEETLKRVQELEAKATKHESDAQEGAAVALDLYLSNLESQMTALRADYDKAFDTGDRDALFKVSQTMAELAAEKKQAEREKRAIPIKAAKPSGTEASPPTQRTTDTDRGNPTPRPTTTNPLVLDWFKQNSSWFNKEPVPTMVARVINDQLLSEGYEDTDPEFYEELNKRLASELPHKFGKTSTQGGSPSPTIQNRGTPLPTNGKLKVRITQEDREMAESLGLTIEAYARQKARREMANKTHNGYTEIL